MNKVVLWGIVLLMVGLLSWFGLEKKNESIKEGWRMLLVGETQVQVEVRDTMEGRNRGLSGREKLEMDEGMLFIFPVKAKYGFWMKKMKFDLDFIWIIGNEVVEITKGVKAPVNGGKLELIKPKVAIDRMLEVSSGFIEENQVKVGDRVEFVR